MSVAPPDPVRPPQPALPWTRLDLVSLLLIVATALGLVWRLWTPGVQSKVDMLIGVYRIFELATAWREGIWYARLGPDLNFTYGAPLFQFYPPLVSYLGLLFYGLGFGLIHAAKATFVTSLVLAGGGMYLFARSVFADRPAAWLSGMMYVTMPYLLLDIYERGAAAEVLALALLPWLFWALRRLLYQGDRLAFFASTVLIAGVMLAHNITMLFVLPAALGYILLLALAERRSGALAPVAAATALGLALCAFYWVPAIFEVKYTHADEYMLGPGQEVTKNLLALTDLFQRTWITDYQGELRFHFALRPLFFGLLGVLVLPFHQRRRRYELGLMALLWLAVMFLQSNLSFFFWDTLPLVRFIQFTWRLYGLASLAVALLIGGVVAVLRPRASYRWALAGVMSLLAIWTTGQRLDPKLFKIWYPIDEAQINIVDLYQRGRDGFPLFGDYQPIAMTPPPMMLTMPQPPESSRLPPASPPPNLTVQAENFARIQLAVDAVAPFPLRVRRIFFPGWQVYVNGEAVPTEPSGKFGLVSAQLPAGQYEVTIQFDQTPLRRVSDLVSILALAVLGAGLVAGWRPRLAWLAGPGLAILLVALVFYAQGPGKRLRTPTAAAANFDNRVHLLGYQLDKTTWRPGEELVVRLYYYVEQAPLVNYKLFLHVAELDDSGKLTQIDAEPMFNFSPTTRWDAGEFVFDQVRLPLAADLKPGRYRLVIGLYAPETVQNLPVLGGGAALPGDRAALGEVEIAE